MRHARNADKPAWTATFGARTPVEIIAAFTDALTDPSTPADTGADPYAPLREAKWDTPHHLYGLASPDGIALVEHLGSTDGDLWLIKTAVTQGPTIWRAYVTGSTPAHLITAVTRSLADQTPVARDPSRIPGFARDRMSVSTRRVPAADLASALERRVSTLTARHTTPPAAVPPHVPRRAVPADPPASVCAPPNAPGTVPCPHPPARTRTATTWPSASFSESSPSPCPCPTWPGWAATSPPG
ncbi:DUF317 domain-containing protein [Streptomyces niveus]|uniref:DUF317 domain-containing protein n=1 Tax=Streptomyces niveus TaxID=193462 RepID=UPI0036387A88